MPSPMGITVFHPSGCDPAVVCRAARLLAGTVHRCTPIGKFELLEWKIALGDQLVIRVDPNSPNTAPKLKTAAIADCWLVIIASKKNPLQTIDTMLPINQGSSSPAFRLLAPTMSNTADKVTNTVMARYAMRLDLYTRNNQKVYF
jgi:hypothetical protein